MSDGTVEIPVVVSETTSRTYENSITVLFAAPLVVQDSSQKLHPCFPLKHELERDLIWKSLKEASRDIRLEFDNGTNDRLVAAIARRGRCLHFSGHGEKGYLLLEENDGAANWFAVEKLKTLMESETSAPFRLVFVSSCFSGPAGNTFASGGVPHVVCCQQDSELKDTAALAFAKTFYLALAFGSTVKESFEAGCKAVRATPNLRDAEAEVEKFKLLPVTGNHNVRIFDETPARDWPSSLCQEALTVRNLIQEHPSPIPPEFFIGREVEMYSVLKQLMLKRVVSVISETKGIGRSSLVCSVCHYINKRKKALDEKFERILVFRAETHQTQFRFLFWDKGRFVPVDGVENIENVFKEAEERSVKVLIVFDRIELLERSQEANKFSNLIKALCAKNSYVKILMTNRRPLGIPSIGEHPITIPPLNFVSTVRLFAWMCPYITKECDRKQIKDILVTSAYEGELLPGPECPEETQFKFDILGKGIPNSIEIAAYSIPKDYVARIKNGTFLDMTTEEIEKAIRAARNLQNAAAAELSDHDSLVSLIQSCELEQKRLNLSAIMVLMQEEGNACELFDVLDLINSALAAGKGALKRCAANKEISNQHRSLDIAMLVEKEDVFALSCMLCAQQSDRCLEAAIALMRFARDDEQLRDKIVSSGGMLLLLMLFRNRDNYELRVVAALALAYIVPCMASSKQTLLSLGLEIGESIHFLITCEPVSPYGQIITKEETSRAAVDALKSFWSDHLGPILDSGGSGDLTR